MLQRSLFKKSPEIKKKNRRFAFMLLCLTTLVSLLFWSRSGNWDLKMPSFSWPLLSSKTFVFEKEKPTRIRIETLKEEILVLLEEKKGRYGLWFKNLESGENFGINENEIFEAASVNKVPIMIAFYKAVEQGALQEDQVYKLKVEDKQEGTGSMAAVTPNTEYFYKELARLCGIESDNTAAHVLLKIVSYNKVKKLLQENNLDKTSITDNLTTPFEAGRLFELVYQGKLLKEENQEKFFGNLANTFFEERIPAGVPQEIRVAHKVGTNIGIYNDCGIVFAKKPFASGPYVLCILGNEVVEEEAKEVLPEISKVVWELTSL